jgi:general secretion pathway protein J
MTLIEVSVALTLLALLSVGILTAFRLGQRAYTQVTQTTAAREEVETAQRLIRRAVEGSVPLHELRAVGGIDPSIAFQGSSDALTFIAESPMAASGGFFRYEFSVHLRSDGRQDLAVRAAPNRRALSASAVVPEETLVRGAASVQWQYQPRGGAVGGLAGSSDVWLNDWSTQKELPALVRLVVRFAEGDRRRWPVLVIAPRLSDEAACQFDVVAQACRGVTS